MNTNDTASLPTLENRLVADRLAPSVNLSPDDYVARRERCVRRLAALGYDAETLADIVAYGDRHPELRLFDE